MHGTGEKLMPRPSTKILVMPRLRKFNMKRLLGVLKRFQKIHSFANINVIARESENPIPMVEMDLERLVQQEQVTTIEVVSYHPQTGELGKEICYQLDTRPRMRMNEKCVFEDVLKKASKKRRR
jgi:hypothetical protein